MATFSSLFVLARLFAFVFCPTSTRVCVCVCAVHKVFYVSINWSKKICIHELNLFRRKAKKNWNNFNIYVLLSILFHLFLSVHISLICAKTANAIVKYTQEKSEPFFKFICNNLIKRESRCDCMSVLHYNYVLVLDWNENVSIEIGHHKNIFIQKFIRYKIKIVQEACCCSAIIIKFMKKKMKKSICSFIARVLLLRRCFFFLIRLLCRIFRLSSFSFMVSLLISH